jgi:hypothetical protein
MLEVTSSSIITNNRFVIMDIKINLLLMILLKLIIIKVKLQLIFNPAETCLTVRINDL